MMENKKTQSQMLEALICPLTQNTLRYDAAAQELISESAKLAYPIRNGIPIMLMDEARKLDDSKSSGSKG